MPDAQTMSDRFPQTTTASEISDAFAGKAQIENGMPSRITIDHAAGYPTVAGDLFAAAAVHNGVAITLSNCVTTNIDGDEDEFDEHEFLVDDQTIIGIHEEA